MTAKTRWVMLALIAALVGAFAPQCKKEKPSASEPADTTTIYPLSVGNHWTYNVGLSTDGGQYEELPPYDMEVLQSDTLNGGTWYSFGSGSIDSLPEDFYANLEGGFHRNAETPGLYFKYPAKAGDSWTVSNVRTGKIMATNVQVSVPAGNFSCYEYSIRNIGGLSDSTKYYCSPDVGMVKFFLWYSNLTYKYELSAFVKAGS